MASPARIAANRRNALRSTGPRTPRGKARSRLNALRHGLSARLFALPPQSLREFIRLHRALCRDLKPASPREQAALRALAAAHCALRRAAAFEKDLFTTAGAHDTASLGRSFLDLCDTGAMNTLLRYQGKAWRAFFNATAAWESLRQNCASEPKPQPSPKAPGTPSINPP